MHTVVRDEEWGRRGRALAARAGQAGSWAGVPMMLLPRKTQPYWSCRGWFASVRRDLLPSFQFAGHAGAGAWIYANGRWRRVQVRIILCT